MSEEDASKERGRRIEKGESVSQAGWGRRKREGVKERIGVRGLSSNGRATDSRSVG